MVPNKLEFAERPKTKWNQRRFYMESKRVQFSFFNGLLAVEEPAAENPAPSRRCSVWRARRKGCLSNKTALATVLRLVDGTQKTRHRLDGYNQSPKVILIGALCKSRKSVILWGLRGGDSPMSRRCLAQPSLADAFVKAYSKGSGFLEDLLKTTEWSAFEALFAPINANAKGAPRYPPPTMFKIVLLQQWYNLSDPQAEGAVRDRLSFRRFCGIPLDAETPDHSSIWRFRQTVDKLGLSEKLLAEVNRQLHARGLIVKKGTFVDATIIAAAVKRPPFEEGPVNPRDPDAGFAVKNDKTFFGYKAHLAVDEESDLIRQAEMTFAHLHDRQRGEAMIQGDEAAYYADKAYGRQPLRNKLPERRIADKIAYKAKRNKPLANWQKWFNTTASSVRAGAERAKRDDEELVWNGAGSLSRAGAQQLPPVVRRLRDEYQAGACAAPSGLSRLGGEVCPNRAKEAKLEVRRRQINLVRRPRGRVRSYARL